MISSTYSWSSKLDQRYQRYPKNPCRPFDSAGLQAPGSHSCCRKIPHPSYWPLAGREQFAPLLLAAKCCSVSWWHVAKTVPVFGCLWKDITWSQIFSANHCGHQSRCVMSAVVALEVSGLQNSSVLQPLRDPVSWPAKHLDKSHLAAAEPRSTLGHLTVGVNECVAR